MPQEINKQTLRRESTHPKHVPTIEELFPDATPEEQRLAAEAFKRFALILLGIIESICDDPERYARFMALTEEKGGDTTEALPAISF